MAALVCNAPEFLGMEGGEAPCQAAVVLSERGDARVVAAVDELGGITLVGCPGQLTRDALTNVARELLVFTGRLWRMPSEEFSSVFEKRLGRSLGDYFSSRIAIGWSEGGFHSGLGRSLERGQFPVVLLLTDSNQEVAEVVAYLRSYSVEIKTLGVELYESSGVEIVMPRVLDIVEQAPHDDREPARPAFRPTPSQLWTPTRSQSSTAGLGVTESAPPSGPASARKMTWSNEPVSSMVENAPSAVEQGAVTSESAAPPSTEPAPASTMPWPEAPATSVSAVLPPPVQSKPVTAAPPPAPKPAAARAGLDGTMPGVMAGRRPTRRSSDGFGTHRGQDQTAGKH